MAGELRERRLSSVAGGLHRSARRYGELAGSTGRGISSSRSPSVRAARARTAGMRLREDRDVEPDRPVLEVVEVEPHEVVEARGRSGRRPATGRSSPAARGSACGATPRAGRSRAAAAAAGRRATSRRGARSAPAASRRASSGAGTGRRCVTRGSSLILNSGPVASFDVSSAGLPLAGVGVHRAELEHPELALARARCGGRGRTPGRASRASPAARSPPTPAARSGSAAR